MRLEWVLMAEGFGTTATSALTAIAINQNVVATPNLPVATKRGVLAHFVADDSDGDIEGTEITVSTQVVSPSNETVHATQVGGKFPKSTWPDLPVALDVVSEFPIRIIEYGTYEIRISARIDDHQELRATSYLYVKQLPVTGPSS